MTKSPSRRRSADDRLFRLGTGIFALLVVVFILLGWTGQTVALIAVLATMALLSTERDRGTLAWTLTNPVSPTSVIAAKYLVAFGVFIASAVLLPMVVSVALATVIYGALIFGQKFPETERSAAGISASCWRTASSGWWAARSMLSALR